jgi:hypothetical protein
VPFSDARTETIGSEDDVAEVGRRIERPEKRNWAQIGHRKGTIVYNSLILPVAGVAELADAQDLGSCGVTPVEVQVLSPAPQHFRLPKKLEQTRINTSDL